MISDGDAKMRLRRLELAVIALTLAFICFMGGYFTGRKGAVNIVSVAAAQSSETRQTVQATAGPNKAVAQSQQKSTAATPSENGGASLGAGALDGAEASGDAVTEQPVSAVTGAPKSGDGKININLASQSELTDLPGIGGVIASRIIDYRRQNGNFSRIEDLRKVSGIGEKRYEAIADKITVD